jgi:hypothetical protein
MGILTESKTKVHEWRPMGTRRRTGRRRWATPACWCAALPTCAMRPAQHSRRRGRSQRAFGSRPDTVDAGLRAYGHY